MKFGSEPLGGKLDVRPGGDFLGQLQRSPTNVTVAVTVNESDAVNECEAVKRALGGTRTFQHSG